MSRINNLLMEVSYAMGKNGDIDTEVGNMAEEVAKLLCAAHTVVTPDDDLNVQRAAELLRLAEGTDAYDVYRLVLAGREFSEEYEACLDQGRHYMETGNVAAFRGVSQRRLVSLKR